MKKAIIKIDNFILEQLTSYIRKWIKKHNFEKHKIDFMIKLENIEILITIVWAILLPVIFYIIAGQRLNAIIHGVVWGAMTTLRYWTLQGTSREMKEIYDILFSMRKNPAYYEMHKQVCEELFIKNRKKRLTINAILIGIYFSLIFSLLFLSYIMDSIGDPNSLIAGYFLVSCGMVIVQTYIHYVFDFDEPTPNEEVKKSLTEIMRREWQSFVDGWLPKPNYGI